MTKTLKELTEEYVYAWWGPREDNMTLATRQSYLAGYQAAQEHAHAALEEAEAEIDRLQTKLSDAGILTTEHLLGADNSSNNSNGWISIKDRLPEDWECCLWYASSRGEFDCGWENNECINLRCKTGCGQKFDVGAIFICEFHRKDKHHEQHYLIDDANNVALIDCFTHWMPLPKPPTEE
jgi:hypothetical protein